jgi:hypothetical protein
MFPETGTHTTAYTPDIVYRYAALVKKKPKYERDKNLKNKEYVSHVFFILKLSSSCILDQYIQFIVPIKISLVTVKILNSLSIYHMFRGPDPLWIEIRTRHLNI